MDTHTTAQLQISARLLRVVSTLVANLDPVKGGKASAMRRVGEELKVLASEAGEGLSTSIHGLLVPSFSVILR
ncbi:hypothetical protein JCM8547_006553 [Rhodosporidiobolus lusitaniae]